MPYPATEYQPLEPDPHDHDADTDTAPLLTTHEVATRLAVSKATVLRRWRNGEIPGYRLATNVLRFDRLDIERYLSGCRRNSTEDGAPKRQPRHTNPDGREHEHAGEHDAR